MLAQRLLAEVASIDFESEGRTIQVSLSIGASYSEGEATLFFDSMLMAAEEALSEASTAGGNRFVAKAPAGSGT